MLRIIPILLVLGFPNLAVGQAQQSPQRTDPVVKNTPGITKSNVYQLGTRSVVIPPPSGFVDAFSQSDYVASIFIATEDPDNEVLTAHVPVEELNRLKKGERAEFDFYTKVSILKLGKVTDMTDAKFAGMVSYFESRSTQILDINGPLMKSAVQNLQKGMSTVVGKEVPLELEQPQNLGSFQKTNNVFSTMLVLTVKGDQSTKPMVAGMSFVKVNHRLLYVYTYRTFTSEKDAEILRDFTREWVGQIVAANASR